MFENIFKNTNVLVTGHTGFKGGWLCSWLNILGANVHGLSLNLPSEPNIFEAIELKSSINHNIIDIRNNFQVVKLIQEIQPDFIFHMAAQPLVGISYEDPKLTYETNFFGTLNILEALRKLSKKCISIIITSDKSYENVEWVWGYRETDILGGKDPYSASKASTEIMINSYVKSFFSENNLSKIGIARAGNVIGGGDWAKGRVIPDCVRAWSKNDRVFLKNPKSTRPWQHVLEPLSGYLELAHVLRQNSSLHGEAFNFGPSGDTNYEVKYLVNEISKHWSNAKYFTKNDIEEKTYEAGLLKLNCDKSLHFLGWKSTLNFQETVSFTAKWYKSFYDKAQQASKITERQILDYSKLAKERNLRWAIQN